MKRWVIAALLLIAPVSTVYAQQITVTYAAPTSATVSSSATVVARPGLKVTKICNTTSVGGGNIWLNPSGGTATTGTGDEAAVTQASGGQGGCVIYGGKVAAAITGVCDSGTCNYTVTVGN